MALVVKSVGKSDEELLVVEEIMATVSLAEEEQQQQQPVLPLLLESELCSTAATEESNNRGGSLKNVETSAEKKRHFELQDTDCSSESMLDQMDKCVGCVEGVEVQHAFEEKLGQHELIELEPPPHQSLSDTEAALIRLQVMERRHEEEQQAVIATCPDGSAASFKSLQESIDIFNICGSDDRGDSNRNNCGEEKEDVSAAAIVAANCSSPSPSTVVVGGGGGSDAGVPGRTAASPENVCDTTMDSSTAADEAILDGSFVSSSGRGVGMEAVECEVGFEGSRDSASPAAALAVTTRSPAARKPHELNCCAVCLEDEKAVGGSRLIQFAELPCCSEAVAATPSKKICTTCVLVLTTPTGAGSNGTSFSTRVGRCPLCRTWIAVKTPKSPEDMMKMELNISALPGAGAGGECQVCYQTKDQLIELVAEEDGDRGAAAKPTRNVCDACFLGQRQPLLYECNQCHVRQRIPHPMYRYQASPDEFGTATWACQGPKCEKSKFTARWRIRPDQIRLIPVGDAPEPWREDDLELARQRVREARMELARGGDDLNCHHHGCAIL